MLNLSPIIIQSEPSKTWQVGLLTSGEPFRASSLLASNGVDIAILDTGLPQHSNSLIAALNNFGVKPEDITLVFNTHSHVDHSHNNSLFENAKIYCSKLDREWTFGFHETLASADDPLADEVRAFYPEMATSKFDIKIVSKVFAIEKMVWCKERWGREDQFCWIEEAVLPAGIKVLPTPGHSPHHLSYIIETDERPVLLCGDALLTRDEENSNLSLIPPFNLENYKNSQKLIGAFDGIIVPGHDLPFDNHVSEN